jgi:hypothetical protein
MGSSGSKCRDCDGAAVVHITEIDRDGIVQKHGYCIEHVKLTSAPCLMPFVDPPAPPVMEQFGPEFNDEFSAAYRREIRRELEARHLTTIPFQSLISRTCTQLLMHPNSDIRKRGAELLRIAAYYEAEAKAALPLLCGLLNDPEDDVRLEAEKAIDSIQQNARRFEDV